MASAFKAFFPTLLATVDSVEPPIVASVKDQSPAAVKVYHWIKTCRFREALLEGVPSLNASLTLSYKERRRERNEFHEKGNRDSKNIVQLIQRLRTLVPFSRVRERNVVLQRRTEWNPSSE